MFKFQFIEVFIVGNGLCAVPENVRQMERNDTQVVPYKVFAFYANTSINRNLILGGQFLNFLRNLSISCNLTENFIQHLVFRQVLRGNCGILPLGREKSRYCS